MAAMDKITIPTLKPRNPLVAAIRFRKAGAHTLKQRKVKRDERRLEQ